MNFFYKKMNELLKKLKKLDANRFELLSNNVVLDNNLNKEFCKTTLAEACDIAKSYQFEGWRLPTVKELATLLAKKPNQFYSYMDNIFTIADCRVWSNQVYGVKSAYYVSFLYERKPVKYCNQDYKHDTFLVRELK